jgi:Ser/Thr protein kinase RdoA (MazF antagonist)
VDRARLDSHYTLAVFKALESFSVDPAEVQLVSLSENVTYRVADRRSDTDYVLRLHRPGYNSIEALESERIWTRALREAGISAPEPLLTRQGQHFVLIDIPDAGEQRCAGMTKWAEGTPLSDYLRSNCCGDERIQIFRSIGELAAAMHNHATGWPEPPGFTRRRLDLDGLLGDAPSWGRFWEHASLTRAERARLRRAREAIRPILGAYGERADNFSLIHADLHPDNIIYNDGDMALIDFDDSAYGWHLYDLASALVEDRSARDYEALQAALLGGYCEHRRLAARDIELLPVFMLVRGMAIIGWFHERPEHVGSQFFEDVKRWVLAECDSYGV